jgi:hypothetical protein
LGQVLFFGLVFIYLFIYFSVLGFKLRALWGLLGRHSTLWARLSVLGQVFMGRGVFCFCFLVLGSEPRALCSIHRLSYWATPHRQVIESQNFSFCKRGMTKFHGVAVGLNKRNETLHLAFGTHPLVSMARAWSTGPQRVAHWCAKYFECRTLERPQKQWPMQVLLPLTSFSPGAKEARIPLP